jgi:hypothetical protein
MLLEKLGLKKEDDREGLIDAALKTLVGYTLNNGEKPEDSAPFQSTQILLRESTMREPALVAANILRPILLETEPALVAQYFSPRVAEILERINAVIDAGPEQFVDALRNSEPAVKQSFLAWNTHELERAADEAKHSSLNTTIRQEATTEAKTDDGRVWLNHGTEDVPLSKILQDLHEVNTVLRPLVAGSGEPRLEARFDKALHAIGQRLEGSTPALETGLAFSAVKKKTPAGGHGLN